MGEAENEERGWHWGGPGVDIIERLARHQSAPVVLLAQPSSDNTTATTAKLAALVNAKTREMMDGC